MPIFEFHCNACDQNFEKLVFGNDPDVECPHCGQNRVEKLMSACNAKVGMKMTAASNPKSGAACGSCSSGSCSSCH